MPTELITMAHAGDAEGALGGNQDQVKELLCQLQREKRTRKALLTQAAHRWVPPPDGLEPADIDFKSKIVSAAIEGDAHALGHLFGRLRIDEMGSDTERFLSSLNGLLPLHRAISGFHFHGVQHLLLSTLQVLVESGADIAKQDHGGNSVLHKALQVCTSAVVVVIVEFLLRCGAPANVQNHAESGGDGALHVELPRLRSKSPELIELLCANGADASAANARGDTPLALVLKAAQRGSTPAEPVKAPLGGDGRNFWVAAASCLVRSGARWEPSCHDDLGRSQLHQLFSGPCPPAADCDALRNLVLSALDSAFDVNARDHVGDSPLHCLCRRASITPRAGLPNAALLAQDLLDRGAVVVPELWDCENRPDFAIADVMPVLRRARAPLREREANAPARGEKRSRV